MKNTDLTPNMQKALDYMRSNNGSAFAGNDVDRRGWIITIAASTLRALERRGLVTIKLSPDGGMMAQLVEGV